MYKVEKIMNNGQFKDFIHLPYRIYENNPCWVAPLDSVIASTLDEKLNLRFSLN